MVIWLVDGGSGGEQQLHAVWVAIKHACSMQRRAAVNLNRVDVGSGGEQQPYAFQLTKATSAHQAKAKISVLRVLQQARGFVVVALLDRVKYRAFHGLAKERQGPSHTSATGVVCGAIGV